MLGTAVLGTAVLVTAAPGCTATAASGSVKAMQATGPTSFVCLANPSSGALADMALPLAECTKGRTSDTSVPHLYALTTQPLRGEVAVVDLTIDVNALVDADPATPGTNFLPVGAAPTDIASTPGGMASFVTVAEPGYEGIFALPSNRIRGGAPQLSDWPACSLPETPGNVVLVVDPVTPGGAARPSCDAAYGAEDPAAGCGPDAVPHCHGDLGADATAAGTPGRYKLLVTLPKQGAIAVIDAQAILDQESGAFEPCRVERVLPLNVSVPPEEAPVPPEREACVERRPTAPAVSSFVSRPSDVALAERPGGGVRAYITDGGAPTIHRIDLPTPCDAFELAPLIATSAEDPARVVTTSHVAVSPLTYDLKRYLYAVDEFDGSLMVFDVSAEASSRTPEKRAHPERNPFQPPDRIRFGSPPKDIVLFEHRADQADSKTGASLPVRCDPGPDASPAAAGYRTSADFTSGAGPRKLRGIFGLVLLASGNVVTLDVDDLDAACRGPANHDPLFGCDDNVSNLPGSSTEYSCGVVSKHEPRSNAFLAYRENVLATEPGVQALPLLFNVDGTLVDAGDEGAPRMRATIPTYALTNPITLPVGPDLERIDPATGLLETTDTATVDAHVLAMNADDPRAHILAQTWNVTYEGALPGFGNHFASLQPKDGGYEFRDPSIGFCGAGVMGASAVADELIELENASPATAPAAARALADYVQVMSDTPVVTDAYWNGQNVCSFTACQQTYGTSQNPLATRDLRIDVAKDDVLFVTSRGDAPTPELKCCFPNLVQFKVRGGGQWVVLGSKVGFLNHGAADADGVCRPRCDANLARLNGRVREVSVDGPVKDDDARAFRNPFFRFAIRRGDVVQRDMRFDFATQAQWNPLQVTLLGASGSTDVQPTAATHLPLTGELVVSDGSLQGLTFINLNTLTVSRQYQ